MKKSRLLLAGLAAFVLAGCSIQDLMFWKKKTDDTSEQDEKEYDYNPTVTGGTKEEQTAILEALNNRKMCTMFGKSSQEIFPYPDSHPTLKEDDGDGIKLTTSQVMGSLTVKISWYIDETQQYFGGRNYSDDAHDIVDIKYLGYGNPDAEFEWKISKMECGGAVAENANILFKASVKNEEYKHDDYKIAELYKFTDEPCEVNAGGTVHKYPNTMDIIDYTYHADWERYYPNFKTNNPDAKEKRFLYVNVPGKVVYLAPDGNWGLLADGENVINFFAGKSGTALVPRNWPNLAVGNYVKISATVDQYQGNVQLTFVTKIRPATVADLDADPSLEYHNLTSEQIASLSVTGYDCQKHNAIIDGAHMFNSLRKVTGTYIEDSLKIKGAEQDATFAPADVEALAASNGYLRFMFKLDVGGGQVMDIAYDYHTEDGSQGVFSALSEKVVEGGSMTLSGCMRYFGNDTDAFITEGNPGVWSLVPFVSAGIQ